MVILFAHAGAIYIGALIAELEYIDIWRAAMVALISCVVMLAIGMLLAMFDVLPVYDAITGAAVLGLGTTFAAKMVLSCDWRPAWIMGATTVVANLLARWIFSSLGI